jgi:hypothetical protein
VSLDARRGSVSSSPIVCVSSVTNKQFDAASLETCYVFRLDLVGLVSAAPHRRGNRRSRLDKEGWVDVSMFTRRATYVRLAQLHSIWYSTLFSLFIQVVAFHPLYTLKLLDCH